jgi:hypothetical protein
MRSSPHIGRSQRAQTREGRATRMACALDGRVHGWTLPVRAPGDRLPCGRRPSRSPPTSPSRSTPMAIAIGDTAPDFDAQRPDAHAGHGSPTSAARSTSSSSSTRCVLRRLHRRDVHPARLDRQLPQRRGRDARDLGRLERGDAAWAAKEGYEFPLLSDFWPHGAVADQRTACSTRRRGSRCAARSSSTRRASSASRGQRDP